MVSTIRHDLYSTSLFISKHDYVSNETKTNSLMYMLHGAVRPSGFISYPIIRAE